MKLEFIVLFVVIFVIATSITIWYIDKVNSYKKLVKKQDALITVNELQNSMFKTINLMIDERSKIVEVVDLYFKTLRPSLAVLDLTKTASELFLEEFNKFTFSSPLSVGFFTQYNDYLLDKEYTFSPTIKDYIYTIKKNIFPNDEVSAESLTMDNFNQATLIITSPFYNKNLLSGEVYRKTFMEDYQFAKVIIEVFEKEFGPEIVKCAEDVTTLELMNQTLEALNKEIDEAEKDLKVWEDETLFSHKIPKMIVYNKHG